MGGNDRVLLNLIRGFDTPCPAHFILSGSWWWTTSKSFSESNHELCVSEILMNIPCSYQLVFIILLTSGRVTHQACLLIAET